MNAASPQVESHPDTWSLPLSKMGSFGAILKKLPRPASTLATLDVGCGSGNFLGHFGPGSVGLELNDAELNRCRAKGHTVYKWSFTEPFPAELEGLRFDAVLLSHFLEHVFSPHQILLEVRRVLKPDGLLIVTCPMVNPLTGVSHRFSRRFGDPEGGLLRRTIWNRGFHGALYGDHVNFFTPGTLRYTCEYAGFRTIFLGTPYLPGPLRWLSRPFWPSAWYIGKKLDDYQYDQQSACKMLGKDGRVVWRI